LVHGFSGDRQTWVHIADVLAAKRQVIRYDLRGHGASQAGNVSYRHADDLLTVLDTLGIRQCDVVGVSMGGSISLNFALDHPERVRRLILISPGLVSWEWSDEWKALWAPIVEAARDGDIEAARELWINHPLFATARAHPDADRYLRQSVSGYSGSHWVADLEQPTLPDLDRLTSLSAPTLLIAGARDLPDFRLIADLIEAAAPRVRRVDVDGAGHLVHLERLAEVIGQIRAFLDS
jgi:pimeloyl-ACP methyl ester carboxylesterase